MKLVLIPAGKFMMGSPKDKKDPSDDEEQHEVEITKPFYMGVYDVTQTEYEKVMGKNPSWFSATGGGKDRVQGMETSRFPVMARGTGRVAHRVQGMDTSRFPVETVSWDDAVEFCRKLSELLEEKGAGRVYRLPTEAEWEYACRAGTTTVFHFGNSLSSEQANFDGNYPYGGVGKGKSLQRTTTVGSYKPNAFGLYDMHGNVWQWCADWYGSDYNGSSPKQNPTGPETASGRVLRGGGWFNGGGYCRSANRRCSGPGDRSNDFGFRMAAVQSGR